jgi:hypothetical protein
VDRKTVNVMAMILQDLAMVALPLLVITVVRTAAERFSVSELARSVEWPFASTLLYGQALLKFNAGVGLRTSRRLAIAGLVNTIVFVLLVTSAVILALAVSNETGPSSRALVAIQLSIFVLSIPTFVVVAGVGIFLGAADGSQDSPGEPRRSR